METHPIYPFKGFWIRLVAAILDWIIILLFAVLVLILLVSINLSDAAGLGAFLIILVVFLLVTMLYKPLLESSEYQGTFGKYLLGMKVVSQNGLRITTGTSFIRTIIFILQTSFPYLNFITIFALLMIGFTEYKQGLHDLASKTYVVTSHWEGAIPLEDNFGA